MFQLTTGKGRLSVAVSMMVCVACALAAGTAGASPTEAVPALKVQYSANALDTDRGAKVLYSRLVHAAEQVCPSEFTGSRLLDESVQSCRRQAIARAVHQINNARLAAVYSATTKRG